MTRPESRLVRWLEVVSDLVAVPRNVVPTAIIGPELQASFEAPTVSWNLRDSAGRADFEYWSERSDIARVQSEIRTWVDQYLNRHALVQWFMQTGDPAPQTSERVPSSVGNPRDRAFVDGLLEPYELHQQLSLPVLTRGVEHKAFVMCRGGSDFTDADLALAADLQPALRALTAQADVLGSQATDCDRARLLFGLTGRELAVLRLLDEGLTAGAIGHRLGTSGRTVHKHLEHVYRKLGVRDRLMAVRVARESGLFCAPMHA